jgi:hypothetical protein
LLDRTTLWVVAAIIVVQAVLWFGLQTLQSTFDDPEVAFLFPVGGATWLRAPNPDAPSTYGSSSFRAAYRKSFSIDRQPRRAILAVSSFKTLQVFLDGKKVWQTIASGALPIRQKAEANWKRQYVVDLTSAMTPGRHELVLSVQNLAGPAMVLATIPSIGLRTDASWEAKSDTTDGWVPVETLRDPQTNAVAKHLPTVSEAFTRSLPLLAIPFALVAAWVFACGRSESARKFGPSARSVRTILLALWALLIANNITKVPYHVGFDVNGHLEYILYLLRNHRIPLANEGWAMFQSPLYHLVSAPLYALFTALFSSVRVVEALRLVPLVCGAMQVQLCYLALKEVHPDREDLQILGTLLGGLLPMNLYMSQNLGNEPLVGMLSSATIVVALQLQRNPLTRWSSRTFALLGSLLGLALLTKLTGLLLFAPVSVLILYVAWLRRAHDPRVARSTAVALATVFGVAGAICGWYYVRNWILLGKPFIGGWDPARGYEWWQEPGFRTFEQFYTFGEALVHPVYSAVRGFLDGIYSTLWLDGFLSSQVEPLSFPPWDLDLMLSSAWLSLVPTCALIIGGGWIVARPKRSAASGELFALVCLVTYLMAAAYLTLRVPSFSTIKATYTMGVVPCYAIIAATGFERLTRLAAVRVLVAGAMAAWGFAAFAAYFVI